MATKRPSDDWRRKPPPDYTSRRVQYRLLVLVVMFMAVIVAMQEASRPENWHWMWWLSGSQPQAEGGPGFTSVETEEQDIDNRLPAQPGRDDPAIPDEFRSATESVDENADASATFSEYFTGVDPALLTKVRDDRPLRGSENPAWYNLFSVLASTDTKALEESSTGTVGYVQLWEHPGAYRGKLVTVRGTLRRIKVVPGRNNDSGIQQFFVGWMRPAGGPNSPMKVYFLELPPGFPFSPAAETDIREDVLVTGFAYKRLPYMDSQNITRTTPLLLAKMPQWQPPPPPTEVKLPGIGTIVLAGLTVGIVAIFLTAMVYRSGRGSRHAASYSAQARVGPGQIGRLGEQDIPPSPIDALRNLGETASHGSTAEKPTPNSTAEEIDDR